MTTVDESAPAPATFQPAAPVPQPAPALPQLADQQAASVQIPTGGYASRVVRIPLPAFALPGVPLPWVEMRNPGMMAQAALDEIQAGMQAVQVGPDGEPVAGADTAAIFEQLQRLMRAWCMWDATSDDDVPPLLPDPASADILRKAPSGVLIEVMRAFQELQNPQ
jgi:hypothetical protein